MPADDFEGTHTLLSDDYAAAFVRTVVSLVPHADRGVVRLDEAWLDEEPDGEDCREAWEAVRDRFERAPSDDASSREAWRVELVDDGTGLDALSRLVELAGGIAGRHFVFEVELAREGRTALSAVPHHSDLRVDVDVLPEAAFAAAEDALSDLEACLVAEDPVAEWVARDRQWSVGPAVCKETLDGRRTSCYGIANLRGVAVAADGTTLRLSWGLDGPVFDDPIGKALSWTLEKLYRPPAALPCGDAERAERVAAFLAETLRRFDGREILGEA
jgi:hypothetical protein